MSKDYVTSECWHNLPEEGPRDIRASYIEHTKGLWVRENLDRDELEIWYDGKFVTAWGNANLIEERLTTMLRTAMELGVAEGKKQCRQALADAFGLKT